MLFLNQPLILPFLCHKTATAFQIDSKKVSNSKLKLDLCNCVKIEMIESAAPFLYNLIEIQQLHSYKILQKMMPQGEWKYISTLWPFNI